MQGFSPFPAVAGSRGPAALRDDGVVLRPARDTDIPDLLRLYADTRAEELAFVPWPAGAKAAFVADQFRLQHQHFVTHYPDARFDIVERRGDMLGRFYVHASERELLLVDISLFAPFRGRGLGRALIGALQHEAQQHGRDVTLHVLKSNDSARRLYDALGFRADGDHPTHQPMRWSPGAAPSVS